MFSTWDASGWRSSSMPLENEAVRSGLPCARGAEGD